ncbi:MAG: hypothetical protein K2H46_00125 [Muribaculaceae bacterium]|nr:hypothetical protein [Muribaculaceae bacterium]
METEDKNRLPEQVCKWFNIAQQQYGSFSTNSDELRAETIYLEGCRMAYTLGRENPEAMEKIDARYRILFDKELRETRLNASISALQGVLAGVVLDSISKSENKFIYGEEVETAVDIAVYAADKLIKKLMDSEIDIDSKHKLKKQ